MVREIEHGVPWREAVARHQAKRNPWLYRIVTDPARDLFFRQEPPLAGARVLDVGAGWGQASIPLARRCSVTSLEPTPERWAFIRAVAAQEGVADQMYFVQADFLQVEFKTQFDLACCIGVLEWVPAFRSGPPREVQIEFLRQLRYCLAAGGQLVIGIENRFGLKYLLGAPDDHIGVPGVAVYEEDLAATKWRKQSGRELRSLTYTRSELADLLAAAGFASLQFYAALPDYKVPRLILPLGPEVENYFAQGGFEPEHDGASGRMLSFQEELRSHYRSLAGLGIARDFVPSFYVAATRAEP
jgi:2-polyprenyl-3-methyl-5-hydroxy-6-metoxy-1,4-benzoquinol methylase